MPHTLLLADDSITIQRVIELTFSGEDIEVVAVGDGEQAIARIPQDRPDIVLADIGMPHRNGYEVSAFVKDRSELAHIPVLLLAGAFEPVDEARAKQVRCDGVLVKPFEPQHVIARVRELLRGEMREPAGDAHDLFVSETHERPAGDGSGYPGRPPRHAGGASDAGRSRVGTLAPGDGASAGAAARNDRADVALDDYFDRLDAAFSTLGAPGSSSQGRAAAAIEEEPRAVPTLDQIIGGAPAGPAWSHESALRAASVVAERPAPGAAAPESAIADAFGALLAVEQGEPGAVPPRLGIAAEPHLSDALVDEVARRVLKQIAPAAARDVVVPIVSEIAERLVREEIARVRAAVR